MYTNKYITIHRGNAASVLGTLPVDSCLDVNILLPKYTGFYIVSFLFCKYSRIYLIVAIS